MGEWNLVKDGEPVKLENENDSIEGEFINYEQSQQYPDSFAVKIQATDGIKVIFANNVLKEKIDNSQVKQGNSIKIVYKGLVKSKNGREYKQYDVYTM